jgi:hypothetical protein
MVHTHQIAPTPFVEANDVRFAYRRFGKPVGVPLVFNQHFTGTMDHWDPAVTDGLATEREVLLFNNAGVPSSSGEVPASFEQMAANAVSFITALELSMVDGLFDARFCGAGDHPSGVRPRETPGLGWHRPSQRRGHGYARAGGQEIFGATYDEPDHLCLRVHFRRIKWVKQRNLRTRRSS